MSANFEVPEDERALLSIMGAIRFDSGAVASALRTGTLSPLAAHGLADLLEGKSPAGRRLVLQGQGKGWSPLIEGAAAYDRLMKVGRFVDAQLARGCGVEEAVIDAAQHFGLSEPTIYRDLRLFRVSGEGA